MAQVIAVHESSLYLALAIIGDAAFLMLCSPMLKLTGDKPLHFR
jgi:hypothetical protein